MKTENKSQSQPQPTLTFKVYAVQALAPVIVCRGKEPTRVPLPPDVVKKLREKYGELFDHIDCFMERRPCFGKPGELCAVIPGSALYGALKEAAGLAGKPLTGDFSIEAAFFPEDAVSTITSKVTLANGQPSLTTREAIAPGARGLLVVIGDVPDVLKAPLIKIGYGKKRGYGTLAIEWQ